MKKLPFFLPFGGCAARCVYCHQEAITGAARLTPPGEIAGILSEEDGAREVCYFGGSFCRFERAVIREYLDAVKHFAPDGSRVRFSTYPGDLSDPKLRELIASYSISCVELGIPSLDPAVLRACAREADTGAIISDLETLRNEGFPLGVQIMIGLPSQTVQSSIDDIKKLAEIKGAQDWDLRLYPALVIEGTELSRMAARGEYKPLDVGEAAEWGGRLLDTATALGFRPIRVGLQESESLAAQVCGGPHHPALGELIFAEALARRLTRANPRGPWIIPSSHISKMTGHGAFGQKRLAFHSGINESKISSLLNYFP